MSEYEKFCVIANETIDSLTNDLKRISLFLWNNPELGNEEVLAHKTISEFLVEKGFYVKHHHPTPTAFTATWSSSIKDGENYDEKKSAGEVHGGFMCEYDALPGIGHACGHNLIAIVAIGAACAVKSVLQHCAINENTNTALNKCRISIFGTHAEENTAGKVDHINAKTMDDLDFALMAHPANTNNITPNYLALNAFFASFTGFASHACERPWGGLNALDAAVLAYQNMSCARQQFEPGWIAHSIFTKAGDSPNIIPHETELSCILRSPKKSGLLRLMNKMDNCLSGAAQATGCKLEVRSNGHQCDDVIQNKTLARIYETQSIEYDKNYSQNNPLKITDEYNKILSPFIKTELPQGSTDMGNVSQIMPSLHPQFNIGCKDSIHTLKFAKETKSDLAQCAAIRQSKVLAHTCLKIMFDSELLREAVENFKHDISV